MQPEQAAGGDNSQFSAPGRTECHSTPTFESMRVDRPALELRSLTKSFLGTRALDDVSLGIRASEIHGLVGENGAGKSTLIKLLAGIHRPDSGSIYWEGSRVNPNAGELPAAFIHQDLGLVDELSVAENIALGVGFSCRHGVIRWGDVRRKATAHLSIVADGLDVKRQVKSLTQAERTLVAVARALAQRARIIVLDEPTAALPAEETSRLFEMLTGLRSRGVTILYVTHRLDEITTITDRVSVLRDGRLVTTQDTRDVTPRQLVGLILGRTLGELYATPEGGVSAEPNEFSQPEVLAFRDLCFEHIGPISLTVERGEIVGVVGLLGAGHEKISQFLTGEHARTSGSFQIGGRTPENLRPWMLRDLGIGYVSSKRHTEMLFGDLTIRENLLPTSAPAAQANERRSVEKLMRDHDIRPRETERSVATLSGGNQQKIPIARLLGATNSPIKLLVLDEPTAGVDVGAKAGIYATLAQANRRGTGTLLISSEFGEVAGMCQRVYVMRDRRIVSEVTGESVTVDNLMSIASGAST